MEVLYGPNEHVSHNTCHSFVVRYQSIRPPE